MSDEQKREEMCGFSAGATAEDSKLGIQRAVCGRDILGEGSGVGCWGQSQHALFSLRLS